MSDPDRAIVELSNRIDQWVTLHPDGMVLVSKGRTTAGRSQMHCQSRRRGLCGACLTASGLQLAIYLKVTRICRSCHLKQADLRQIHTRGVREILPGERGRCKRYSARR